MSGDMIGVVSNLTYLGSAISDDGELDTEVTMTLLVLLLHRGHLVASSEAPTNFPELGSIAWNPASSFPGRHPYSAAVWF